MINDISDKLKDSAVHLDNLIDLFNKYKKSTPSFLDDFLAPDGIITKKRDIDNNINKQKTINDDIYKNKVWGEKYS